MGISRVVLGTKKPALLAAADYLFERFASGSTADFRQVIVVVPGRRAGRRLLEILVDQAESRRVMLVPPEIETVGHLPEQLYRPKRPFASDLTQQLVWAETLRSTPAERLAAVIPFPPDAGDTA